MSADSCCRKGPLLDLHGPAQSLNSSHVRDRDEAMLSGVLFWGCMETFSSWPRHKEKCFMSLFLVGLMG